MARFSREAQAFAKSILDDPEYRKNLKVRAIQGVLAPAVETMLYAYAYGKPAEVVEMQVTATGTPLSDMSAAELAERAKVIYEAMDKERRTREAEELAAQALAADMPLDFVRSDIPELVPGAGKSSFH